nr:hypothetical protein [Sphingomonas sp. PP-CC-1A-547]
MLFKGLGGGSGNIQRVFKVYDPATALPSASCAGENTVLCSVMILHVAASSDVESEDVTIRHAVTAPSGSIVNAATTSPSSPRLVANGGYASDPNNVDSSIRGFGATGSGAASTGTVANNASPVTTPYILMDESPEMIRRATKPLQPPGTSGKWQA